MVPDSEETFEESLYFHLSRQTHKTNWIYLFIMGSLLGAVLILPVLHVQVGVSATGMIRTTDPEHILRSPASGTLSWTNMKENQSVSRYDTLATLRTDQLDLELTHADHEITQLSQRLHDLETLLNNPLPENDNLDSLRDPLIRHSFAQWMDRHHQQTTRLNHANEELHRINQLAEKQFSSPKELENAFYEAQQIRQNLEQIHSSQVYRWQELHEETRLTYKQLLEQRDRLMKERNRHIITAPRNGTLHEVISLQPGSELHEQQELGRITPDGELIAELYIPSDDIGWIREKMPVMIQLEAFDYREWGLLHGTVQTIPRDITMDPTPHYRVRVSLATTHLELDNGFHGHFRKGMALKARLLLKRRSLLQLLFDRAEQWLDPRWSSLDTQSTYPS
ncbi:MAG: HlyD family efflux transporter periplasmic adaptor subunit [Balneolaceae bacterium]